MNACCEHPESVHQQGVCTDCWRCGTFAAANHPYRAAAPPVAERHKYAPCRGCAGADHSEGALEHCRFCGEEWVACDGGAALPPPVPSVPEPVEDTISRGDYVKPSDPERCACASTRFCTDASARPQRNPGYSYHSRTHCCIGCQDHPRPAPPVPSPAEIADALELAVKIGGNVACRAVQIGLRASAETSVNMGILRAAVAHLRRLHGIDTKLASRTVSPEWFALNHICRPSKTNDALRAERDMLALHIEHNEAVLSEVVDQRDALALRVEQFERNCGRHHKVISDLTTERDAIAAKLALSEAATAAANEYRSAFTAIREKLQTERDQLAAKVVELTAQAELGDGLFRVAVEQHDKTIAELNAKLAELEAELQNWPVWQDGERVSQMTHDILKDQRTKAEHEVGALTARLAETEARLATEASVAAKAIETIELIAKVAPHLDRERAITLADYLLEKGVDTVWFAAHDTGVKRSMLAGWCKAVKP